MGHGIGVYHLAQDLSRFKGAKGMMRLQVRVFKRIRRHRSDVDYRRNDVLLVVLSLMLQTFTMPLLS